MNQVLEIAKMIDHSLLHPTMTQTQLKEGCELAKKFHTASVCIKPYAVRQAAAWLEGSDVLVCTVIGFPHGNSTTAIKIAECEQACEDGAVEIDMVVNIGKVLEEDWEYVEEEIASIQAVCNKFEAALKVIFENDFLPEDHYKIRLCEICTEVGVAFVKTSTGYGFSKGSDGKYSYQGATDHDLRLMRKHSGPNVQVKAAGAVRTLDDALRVKALGASRIGASATQAIVQEAMRRFEGKAVEGGGEVEGY